MEMPQLCPLLGDVGECGTEGSGAQFLDIQLTPKQEDRTGHLYQEKRIAWLQNESHWGAPRQVLVGP